MLWSTTVGNDAFLWLEITSFHGCESGEEVSREEGKMTKATALSTSTHAIPLPLATQPWTPEKCSVNKLSVNNIVVAGFKTESPTHQKKKKGWKHEAGVLLPRKAGRKKLRPRAPTQPIPVPIYKGKPNCGHESNAPRWFYHAAMGESDS